VVKIGDGETTGEGVGLGLGLGLWNGLGSGLGLDSGSDGDGDGSGSDLHHGTHRATMVTTSRKTPTGVDRRRIQQKSNEWKTFSDSRLAAAPVYIDAAAWCTRAPPTGAGEHRSVTRERKQLHFRKCQMHMDICTSYVCTKKRRPAFLSRMRSHEVTLLAKDYDAPPDRYLCGLMGCQEAPIPDYMWRTEITPQSMLGGLRANLLLVRQCRCAFVIIGDITSSL
jgi:hypothetical protein